MTDKVRVQDYVKFLVEHNVPYIQSLKDKREAKFKECKEKYESGRLAKLFGWKYEKSGAYYDDRWDTYEENQWREKTDAEVRRCEYIIKINRVVIDAGGDVFVAPNSFLGMFYSWCEKNDIPY